MTRVEWFKENVDYFTIYEVYEAKDFTDIYCCRTGSNTILYRVRGNDKDGFTVTEK